MNREELIQSIKKNKFNLAKVGKQYGFTREYPRQLLVKHNLTIEKILVDKSNGEIL